MEHYGTKFVMAEAINKGKIKIKNQLGFRKFQKKSPRDPYVSGCWSATWNIISIFVLSSSSF